MNQGKFMIFNLELSENEVRMYDNDDCVKTDNRFPPHEYISKKLLDSILIDDRFYDYLIRIIDNPFATLFSIYYFKNDDVIKADDEICISNIVRLLDEKENLTDKEKERLKIIKEKTSVSNLYDKLSKDKIRLMCDDKEFYYSEYDAITVFLLPEDEFNNYINSVSKDELFIAMIYFVNRLQLNKKYVLPEYLVKRQNDLFEYKLHDCEANNKIVDTKDPIASSIKINEKLEQEILKDMPEELTKFEKAVYIYIKMCKVLSYDQLFYIMDQRGEIAEYHRDINKIVNITPENNLVVCYQFNAIYAYFLRKLGINYEISSSLPDTFGGSHAYLKYRYGKYLMEADAVTSILAGDLVLAKIDLSLTGFKCINKNQTARKEANESIAKVYDLLKEKEQNPITFFELINAYRTGNKDVQIELDKKIEIFIKLMNDNHLYGVDKMGYLLQVKRNLFDKEERMEKISINFVRKNTNVSAEPAIIVVFSNKHIKDAVAKKRYIIYIDGVAKEVTFYELKTLFENDTIEYLDNEPNPIFNLEDYIKEK